MSRKFNSTIIATLVLLNFLAVKRTCAQGPRAEVAANIETSTSERKIRVAPLLAFATAKLSLLDKAYLDAYWILHDDNACSRMYGGPAAIEVLNRLTEKIKPAFLDRDVALRMKGDLTYALNYSTGIKYRVFEKAELNTNGPFYRTGVSATDTTVARVGAFSANTREARLTILLHELGHMIEKPNGQWVLPNDGQDRIISRDNTQTVINVCREQITQRLQVTSEATLTQLQQAASDRAHYAAATPQSGQDANSKAETNQEVRQFGSQLDARCASCRREIQIPQDY